MPVEDAQRAHLTPTAERYTVYREQASSFRRPWMGTYSSEEAARALEIAPMTLRRWTTEFAAWLTPPGRATRARRFTEEDLALLRRAAELMKLRRGYAFVCERLAAEFGATERARTVGEAIAFEAIPAQSWEPAGADILSSESHPGSQTVEPADGDVPPVAPDPGAEVDEPPPAAGVIEAEVIEPEPQLPPDIGALLERMADLYHELLRNKEQEIAALRQALDTAELSAANERRELETLGRLAAIMERENTRLTAELEEARRQAGVAPLRQPTRRGRLARWLGRNRKTQPATQAHASTE
jgi:hypothetical protein